MFLRVIFLENCKMTVPYNSMQNNINFKLPAKGRLFSALFKFHSRWDMYHHKWSSPCIFLTRKWSFHFIYIHFRKCHESLKKFWINSWKNARNNFPNLWSRLSESRLSFIGSCSPLPIGVRKDGGGWESLPFYSCWRTGVTGS